MVMAAQDFLTDMVVDDEALAEWLCRWLWQHRIVFTDMVVDDEALAEWLCRWLWQHTIFLPIWWWMMRRWRSGYVDGYGSTGFCYRYGGG